MTIKTKGATALIVMAKPPIKGKVKTRLAATVGEDEALRIYEALLTVTKQLVSAWEGPLYIWHDADALPVPGWESVRASHYLQEGSDLGERMASALETVLDTHRAAMIIGTDCPAITPEHLDEAALQLESSDVVIGPAVDGGYYLLGLKEFSPSLFSDMPWSTDQVLQATIYRCQALHLTVHEGPVLRDVDTEGDLGYYGGLRPRAD